MSDWEDLVFVSSTPNLYGRSALDGNNAVSANLSTMFNAHGVPAPFSGYRGFAFNSDYSKIIVCPFQPQQRVLSLYYLNLVSTSSVLSLTWGGAYISLPTPPDLVVDIYTTGEVQTAPSYYDRIEIMQCNGAANGFIVICTIVTPTNFGTQEGPAYIYVDAAGTPSVPTENWFPDNALGLYHSGKTLFAPGGGPCNLGPDRFVDATAAPCYPAGCGSDIFIYPIVFKKEADTDDPAVLIGGNIVPGTKNNIAYINAPVCSVARPYLDSGAQMNAEQLGDSYLYGLMTDFGTDRLAKYSAGGSITNYPGTIITTTSAIYQAAGRGPGIGKSFLHTGRSYTLGRPSGATFFQLWKNGTPVDVDGGTFITDTDWDGFSPPRCYQYSTILFPPPPASYPHSGVARFRASDGVQQWFSETDS